MIQIKSEYKAAVPQDPLIHSFLPHVPSPHPQGFLSRKEFQILASRAFANFHYNSYSPGGTDFSGCCKCDTESWVLNSRRLAPEFILLSSPF